MFEQAVDSGDVHSSLLLGFSIFTRSSIVVSRDVTVTAHIVAHAR
jgi:hypothetical protein